MSRGFGYMGAEAPGSTANAGMGPDSSAYVARNSFTYEADLAAGSTLAPGISTNVSFNIDGDSDFFWTKLAAFAMVASDGTIVTSEQLPSVTLLIQNTTTGRYYMSGAVPLANIAGSARLPYILPMVTYFPAKASIGITLQNVSDNTTYSQLYLSFHGIKAFR